jgi:OmpA-OmpF porin, OOP family
MEEIMGKTANTKSLLAALLILLFGFTINLYSQENKDSLFVQENKDSLYAQENNNSKFSNKLSDHLKKGTLLFSLEYDINKSFTDYTTSNTISSGLRIMGKYILPINNHFNYGFGLYGGFGTLTGADLALQNDPRGYPGQFSTSIFFVGLGLELSYKVTPNFYPYTFFSLTDLFFQPKNIYGEKLPNNALGVYSNHALEPGVEAGFRYFITSKLAINASLTYYFFPNDYLDDLQKGAANDKYSSVNLGLSYAPFAKSTSFKDSDGDGVEDDKDMCPNTPKGVAVDEFGCPVDSDHDGVPDYLDKCPDTPAGTKVDSTGCPMDSDHDGVPDYLDKCPDTLPGLKVDSLGCPIDSDHDGVPDYLDKCPDTPVGTEVDESGCPVSNKTNETKVTPQNENKKSNQIIRIIPPSEIGTISLYLDTYFEPSRDKLLPNAFTILNVLVNTMKAYPDTKWQINGYTDSTGAAKQNLEISKKAAQTVADYLISKGANPKMLKVTGYGESNPAFSNDFPDGRALNRRVEIKYVK